MDVADPLFLFFGWGHGSPPLSQTPFGRRKKLWEYEETSPCTNKIKKKRSPLTMSVKKSPMV